MADTIDLSGEKFEEPKKTAREQRVKDRPQNASRIYTRVDRSERAWEKDIRERCERTQARLVEWLEGREDEELAMVLREDGMAMIGGLIAVCGQAAWLRTPIVAAMTIFEPLIAFGRLIRVLGGRLRDMRVRQQVEREWLEQEAAAEAERQAQEAATNQQPAFRHNIVE